MDSFDFFSSLLYYMSSKADISHVKEGEIVSFHAKNPPKFETLDQWDGILEPVEVIHGSTGIDSNRDLYWYSYDKVWVPLKKVKSS